MNFEQMNKIRKEMTFSLRRFSKMLGAATEEIKTWSVQATIPQEHAIFLNELNKKIELIAQDAVLEILKMNPKENNIILIKYNNDDDFEFSDPELFALVSFYEAHTFLLIKITLLCKEKNINLLTIKFERKKYVSWLNENGFCNCAQHRFKWVSSSPHYPVAIGQIIFMDRLIKSSRHYIKQIKNLIHGNFYFDRTMGVKIDISRNILLQGILDLAQEVLSAYKRNKLIPSASMVRSLLERQSLLFYLSYCVKDYVENSSEDSNSNLKKIFFGSRGAYAEIEAINVMTLIKKQIEHELQDSRLMELYDELSNLVHPNCNGVWDAYFNLDVGALITTLQFHDKGNIGLTILTALSNGLGLSILWYERLGKLLPHYKKLGNSLLENLVD